MRFLWCLFAAPLFGQYLLPNVQFSNLATTRDGTVLYFSSPLSLRGDDEFAYQKIFSIDPAGIHLVEQFERGPSVGAYAANFYNAIEPDVSGDGSIRSFVAQRTCNGGSACIFVERYESHITGAGPEVVYTGRTHLSRNGRYALRYGATGIKLPGDPVPALIDLSTGERRAVPGVIPEGRQVASDGTVVTMVGGALELWKAGVIRPLPALPGAARVVLSDDASVIAIETPGVLLLNNVASGKLTSVAFAEQPTTFGASFSDDARLLCYLNGGQAYLYDRFAGSSRNFNDVPEGVREAVISGDGSTVWEATNWGRLLRIDVASDSVQEVIPRTPLITFIQGAPVPGSLNWLYGSGLNDMSVSASLPLPEFLAGQAVLLNSAPARILQLTPSVILYQIPFETPERSVSVSLASNNSPFESPRHTLQLVPYSPEPVASGPTSFGPVIANRDFSALIDDTNPALAGAIVHVYFTGLGALSPPLASGVAPLPGQVFPVVHTPSCVYYRSPGVTAPAELLYATNPAGLIGVYQVDLHLPLAVSGLSNNPRDTDVSFDCDGSVFFIPMNFSGSING